MSNAAKFEVPGSGDDGKAYTYNEVGDAFALTDMASQAELDAHASDTTSVHGIADTSVLATATSVSTAVSNHAAATDPHGDRAYADGLASNYEAAGAVSTHSADTTSVHGIADTSALLDTADIGVSVQGYSAVLAATTASFTTADETKLDGIEAAADVTDETNVVAALSGATLTDLGTPASGDKILLLDASDSDNLKVAQFSTFGGGATVQHPSIFASGEYKTPWGFNGWATGGRALASAVANCNNLVFAFLHRNVAGASFDAMAVNVQTAADAASTVLLATYAADGTGGYPGTLVGEAGEVSIATTGTKEAVFSSPVTPAEWFWVLMFTSVAGSVIPKLAAPAVATDYGWLAGSISSSSAVTPSHIGRSAYTYPGAGSAPSTAPTGLTVQQLAAASLGAMYVAMRKA